ncbi:MAG: hypothetical protein IJJ33_06730, partial [Victivallales bacterium]|nr:hypothetical protein [Victivallales bacterium]
GIPFQGGTGWQVVLKSGKGAYSEPLKSLGLEVYGSRQRGRKPFRDDPPLAGVLDLGKGKVAYLGFSPACTFFLHDGDRTGTTGHRIAQAVFAKDGLGRFLANFYTAMCAGHASLAQATLPAIAPMGAKRGSPRSYRGVIGPRTRYSTGESTPDEYVAAAQAAGLDFVVFLEDFEHLSFDDFERLRADCSRLSQGEFLAVPGFAYRNIDGNHQYVFSPNPIYPSEILLSPGTRRFKTFTRDMGRKVSGMDLYYLYSTLSFECVSGWYDFGHNPYPYYDMRSVCGMALVTQEGGRTVDFSLQGYADTNRSVQEIWPHAITLMKSAAEMALVTDGTYFHNQIHVQDFGRLEQMLALRQGRMSRNRYPGVPAFGKIFVTQGPFLNLDLPRGDMNPNRDIYSSVLNVWPLALKASAQDGLKTVEIWDGTTLLRRFHPAGKNVFDYETILPNDRQRHVWARLESMGGKVAVTRSSGSDSWLMRDYYCMDRNNPLLYSLQSRKDGSEYLVTYAADGVHPWKGPWIGRIRPLGAFVTDPVLGTGKLRYDGSPEWHPQPNLRPAFYSDGHRAPNYPDSSWQGPMVPNEEGGIHNYAHPIVLSSNVMIASQTLDGVFGLDVYPVIHTHATLAPFKKSEYLDTTATRTLWLLKPEGVSVWLWEQDFTLLKDYPTSANGVFLSAGGVGLRGAKLAHARLDGRMTENPTGMVTLRKGDFLCYEGNFYGTLVIHVLEDGLCYDCRDHQFVFTHEAKVVPAGWKKRIRLLFTGIHRLTGKPVSLAEVFSRDFNLAGDGSPGYQVTAARGKVTGTQYTLDVEGTFEGCVKGLANLPANLGMRLHGMRDNCGVMLKCGETKARILPVENGIAYAVLQECEESQPIVAGAPFRVEASEISVMLSGDSTYQHWRAEIHNPTDHAITTILESDPVLTSAPAVRETITLAPGECQVRIF